MAVFRLNITIARPLWKYWINNKRRRKKKKTFVKNLKENVASWAETEQRIHAICSGSKECVGSCVRRSQHFFFFFVRGFLAPRWRAHAGRVTTVVKAESWEIGHRKM